MQFDGNREPVADDDSASIDEDTTAVVDVLTNHTAVEIPVLNNDSDVDNDQLVPVVTSPPANGTVTVLANGRIRYTPNAGFSGNDTFTYRASDGQAQSAPATVHVLVQPSDPRGCTIIGTEGDDTIVGTLGRDVICGLGGDDVIRGLAGNDVIYGDGGNDIIEGNAGNDTIYGGAGADWMLGGLGDDRLHGEGAFLNVAVGGSGRDACRNAVSVECEDVWR